MKFFSERSIYYCKDLYLHYNQYYTLLPQVVAEIQWMESSTQPIGVSEYDLEKFYPEKVEGTIPTIEEIEMKLSQISSKN